jgi:uncharacterized protein (DUF1800 family)
MSTDPAFTALTRFGMGVSPDLMKDAAHDPKGWLSDQLTRRQPQMREFARLAGSDTVLRRLRDVKDPKQRRTLARSIYQAEAQARTAAAVSSPAPFVERLVRFWSNHLSVSVSRASVVPLAGAFEREAIRPHIGGKYADMLIAATKHPAMLGYLDNRRSTGPDSPVGERTGAGENENLAREVLELHTLGADAGYAQFDVESLAAILTGWTVSAKTGTFQFATKRHQPGAKVLLGHDIEAGLAGGEHALRELARHHATARRICHKLARHFIADDPPPMVTEALARLFLDTDGDLRAVTQALIMRPEPWSTPMAKVRTPDDLVVATARALGTESLGPSGKGTPVLLRSLRLLGQAPWAAPSPAGWPDRAEDWIAPDALMRRLEWASAVAERAGKSDRQPADWQILVGSDPGALSVIEQAEASERLFLALASSGFQRR